MTARASVLKFFVVAGCAALLGCQQEAGNGAGPGGSTLSDPSQTADVLERHYTPEAQAAQVTGPISTAETYRLGGVDGSGETVLALTGENGLRIEAQLVDMIDSAATVSGQSIGGLMALPPGAQPSHYRITSVQPGTGRPGLCGEATASDLVTYEIVGSPPETLSVLITSGGAPGQPTAVLCQALRYTRAAG